MHFTEAHSCTFGSCWGDASLSNMMCWQSRDFWLTMHFWKLPSLSA